MWQPSMEVNWMSLGFALLIDEAVYPRHLSF